MCYYECLSLKTLQLFNFQDLHVEFNTLTSKIVASCIFQQKRMLGEKLFAAIQGMRSLPTDATDKAGKITGMLLEMKKSEVVNLLDSPQHLKEKVQQL